MTMHRRAVAAAALGLPFASASCGRRRSAPDDEQFPARDITMIIPGAAGGGLDIYARLVGGAMESRLPRKVNVVPENEPSGGGGKGVTRLFRAAPDGYTIGLLNVPGIFVLQRLRGIPYDFGAFTWLGTLTVGESYGVAVSGRSPLRTFDDLRTLSGERELTFATTGPEGTGYVCTVIATHVLGLRARLVTGYKSSTDYLVGALRGDTDAVIATLVAMDRLEGQLRILATFEEESSIPGAPGANALGHPELSKLMGARVFAAPPGVPEDVIEILAGAIFDAVSDERVVTWARRTGEDLSPRTPQQTAEIVSERRTFLETWREVVAL